MDDAELRSRIEALEEEGRRLRSDEEDAAAHGRDDAVARDGSRLEEIRVELDRLWDLQRQRRALRSSGGDPDDASERSADVVEGYEQ